MNDEQKRIKKEKHWLIHAEVVRANRLESENGEDDNTGVNGCRCVAYGENESVFNTIVSWWIVAAECDEWAKSDVKRIKDLSGRV